MLRAIPVLPRPVLFQNLKKNPVNKYHTYLLYMTGKYGGSEKKVELSQNPRTQR